MCDPTTPVHQQDTGCRACCYFFQVSLLALSNMGSLSEVPRFYHTYTGPSKEPVASQMGKICLAVAACALALVAGTSGTHTSLWTSTATTRAPTMATPAGLSAVAGMQALVIPPLAQRPPCTPTNDVLERRTTIGGGGVSPAHPGPRFHSGEK